jgi:hypothetical protein
VQAKIFTMIKKTFEILGTHSGEYEDHGLLGFGAVCY